jgi:hypothetical protein
MTDIATIVPTTRTIDILHPATKEPIGLRIDLRPESHPAVREAVRKITNDRLNLRGKLSAERMEANRLEVLIASIDGWSWEGDTTFEGEKLAFAEPNVRKVLKKLPWIRDQVDIALAETEEFFRTAEGGAN